MKAAMRAILLAAVTAGAAQEASQSGIAEVNGTRLYYEAAGSGHPVVLIHGGAVDSRAWDEQFEIFAQQFQVIRYDLRGAGRSANLEQPFSNSEDLHQLLRYLKVDQAHLVGISRGGGIAYDFTLEHPEMVSALVLVSANLSNTPEEYEKMFERTVEEGKEHGAAAAARVWGLDPHQGPVREAARERVLQIIEENITRFRRLDGSPAVRQLSSSDVPRSQRLGEINAPTLVISGERDGPNARANYERWAREIRGAKKATFPNAAHLVPIDQPEEFNRTVLEFLAGLPK